MGTERSFLFLQDWGVFLILAKELGDSNNRSAKEGAPEIYTLHPRVYARTESQCMEKRLTLTIRALQRLYPEGKDPVGNVSEDGRQAFLVRAPTLPFGWAEA